MLEIKIDLVNLFNKKIQERRNMCDIGFDMYFTKNNEGFDDKVLMVSKEISLSLSSAVDIYKEVWNKTIDKKPKLRLEHCPKMWCSWFDGAIYRLKKENDWKQYPVCALEHDTSKNVIKVVPLDNLYLLEIIKKARFIIKIQIFILKTIKRFCFIKTPL